MKALIIFAIVLLASCSYQSTNTDVAIANDGKTEITNSTSETAENSEAETVKANENAPLPDKKFSLPTVKKFGVYSVIRNSDLTNESGQQTSPFKEVEIPAIYWKEKPETGKKVTVIALDTKFLPLELSVRDVRRTKNEYTESCGQDKNESFWKVELDRLENKEMLEMKPVIKGNADAYPFEVVVIYPAVEFARQIKPDKIEKKNLPKDAKIKEVTAAIDLTNDGIPDLIELKYCCERSKSRDDKTCEYSDCGQWWKKVGGKWAKTYDWSPC